MQELALNISIRDCKDSAGYTCKVVSDGVVIESQNVTIELAETCSSSATVGLAVGLILAILITLFVVIMAILA